MAVPALDGSAQASRIDPSTLTPPLLDSNCDSWIATCCKTVTFEIGHHRKCCISCAWVESDYDFCSSSSSDSAEMHHQIRICRASASSHRMLVTIHNTYHPLDRPPHHGTIFDPFRPSPDEHRLFQDEQLYLPCSEHRPESLSEH